MHGSFWVYMGRLSSPMFFRDFEKMIRALAANDSREMVDICCGYDVYRINSKVINFIANNYLRKQVTIVSYCGESQPLETLEDIMSLLRKSKSERFFIDGEIIKCFTNPFGDK